MDEETGEMQDADQAEENGTLPVGGTALQMMMGNAAQQNEGNRPARSPEELMRSAVLLLGGAAKENTSEPVKPKFKTWAV